MQDASSSIDSVESMPALRFPALLLLLGMAFLPSSSQAFARSKVDPDVCLFWDMRILPWTMNQEGDPELGYERSHRAFQRSFDAWQGVGCSDISFLDQSPTQETRVGFVRDGSNENLVVFRPVDCTDAVGPGAGCLASGSCANEFNCWDHGSSVIAVTTTTFLQNTGKILDADIEMNSAWFDFTDGDGPPCTGNSLTGCVSTDVQNTATHEIGHVLGLDHTPIREATMFASAPRGETAKRRLATDDVDGICSIYPAGEPTATCGEEAVDGGCGCQTEGGTLGGLGLAFLLLLGLRQLGRPSSLKRA